MADPNGKYQGAIFVFHDLTRIKELESTRRDFVANVSHELKTPVGAIRLLAEAVGDAADDPAAVKRFSDRMLCLLEGTVVLEGRPADLSREQVTQAFFGLGESA